MISKAKPIGIICLTFAFLLHGFSIFGQDNKNDKMVKLYTNFAWNNTENSSNLDSTIVKNKETQIGYFSPSFALISSKGNFHEFELSRLTFNRQNSETSIIDSTGNNLQTISGGRTTNFLIGFRYEHDIMLFKKKDKSKFQYFLGFSVNPYFKNTKYDPKISTSFPTKQNDFSVSLAVIPRINYNLNDKWFIDINIPYYIADASLVLKKDDNPTIEVSQRTTTTINLDAFPSKCSFRIGLGIRI